MYCFKMCVCETGTTRPGNRVALMGWAGLHYLGAKFTTHLMTIWRQFYKILHTYANVLIHKTSCDNFTTNILRSLFGCLMTFQIIRFQHHPTRKTSLYRFIRLLIQLYS